MDFNLLVFLASILFLGYLYIKKKFSFWADRGVPTVKPVFPFGNLKGVSYSLNHGERMQEIYQELKKNNPNKSPIGGVYSFIGADAIVLDVELLRNIFVKDFQVFPSRGMYVNEKGDPLTAHMFSLPADKWKNLRPKLSPTFSSGKMKLMYSTMLIVADQLKEHLETVAGQEVEIKELLAQFTTDIIGNVAFGIECNSMKDEETDFRKYGKMFFELSPILFVKRLLVLSFPELALKLNINLINPGITEFFTGTIRETVEYREKNNVKRNDFLELLMQIKNTGRLEGETTELGKLTFDELAAQTFVFFIAGFETSSSTMTFATYELALNQSLQEQARAEILEVLERHGGVMTYEAATEMHLLDRIIQETLRKYPIVPVLRRKAEQTYPVPNTKLVIDKGMVVLIPVMGIHHDPEIYPEPEKFDPERFTKENIAERHPYAWIPFGKGPRDCIGLRFGMMQSRIGLATLLRNYQILPTENTPVPIKLHPSSVVLSPVGGMNVKLEKLT